MNRGWNRIGSLLLSVPWGCAMAGAADDDVLVEPESIAVDPVNAVLQRRLQLVRIVQIKKEMLAEQQAQVARTEILVANMNGVAIINGKRVPVNLAFIDQIATVVKDPDQPISEFSDEQFDRLVFWKENSQQVQWKINSERQKLIDELDSICMLTPEQRKKLEFVGRAERERFFLRVEDVRRKCRDGKISIRTGVAEIGALREKVSDGLFDADSFFAKYLRVMLTVEQFDKLAAYRRSAIDGRINRLFPRKSTQSQSEPEDTLPAETTKESK